MKKLIAALVISLIFLPFLADSKTQLPVGRRATHRLTEGDSVEAKYYSSLENQIMKYWALPSDQDWPESLRVIITLKIRSDGIVVGKTVDELSESKEFNLYVYKTISKAAPLPKFPDEIKEEQIKIGLVFRPQVKR
jgi:outer membrane biosynthesis protein TonB